METPAGGGKNLGFIWRDGELMNLAHFVPADGAVPNVPSAINNLGQIAGGGSVSVPQPQGVAFRLTPALPSIPGNTNCDETVNVDDLVNVILQWNPQGPVGGRPADVNRDNRIDAGDLLDVIVGWSVNPFCGRAMSRFAARLSKHGGVYTSIA